MVEKKLKNLAETQDVFLTKNTYALQRVEGQVSVDRQKVILDEGLNVGDRVCFFRLPDGKLVVAKSENPSDLRIMLITQAYIQFDGEVNIKEV